MRVAVAYAAAAAAMLMFMPMLVAVAVAVPMRVRVLVLAAVVVGMLFAVARMAVVVPAVRTAVQPLSVRLGCPWATRAPLQQRQCLPRPASIAQACSSCTGTR